LRLGERRKLDTGDLQVEAMADRIALDRGQGLRPARQRRKRVGNAETEITSP